MFASVARVVRIYMKLQLLHLRIHLEYEADFWIGILGVILKHSASFVFIWILFQLTPEIKGWSLWEMAFLYTLYIIPLGLVEIFYDGQWELPRLVNLGEFDQILLRPISPALQVITQISSIHGFGSVLLGLFILVRVFLELNLEWGMVKYVFLVTTFVNSILIIGSLNFITNCMSFWEPAQSAAFPVFVQNMTEFAKYPNNLYTYWVRIMITWILPLSFVSYFPSLVLLDKSDGLLWLGYATPLVGPLFLVITNLVWRWGLTCYQGTGS